MSTDAKKSTEMRPRILLVDDDRAVHQAVEFRLRRIAAVTAVDDAASALALVQTREFDAALVDVNLGEGLSGPKLISRIREIDADLSPIVFTAYTDYATALDSFEAQSFDFIPKSLGDDREFFTKINRAVTHTREQRTRSRHERDARCLRTALGAAVVDHELETTSGDLQRGLLGESLRSFSAILGKIELLNFNLKRQLYRSPHLAEEARLSGETLEELHEYVEKLRNYFAEPVRSVGSVNALLAEAVRMAQEATAHFGERARIEQGELRPNWRVAPDGRALLRVLVILLGLLLKTAPSQSVIFLLPSILHHPASELNLAKSRSYARILHATHFRSEEKTALAFDLGGPAGGMTAARAAALFAAEDLTGRSGSPRSVLALVARLDGALMVESKPGGGISYRLIVKFPA